jgi:hypothetical protein
MMIRTLLTATAAMALLAGGAQAGEGAKKKPAAAAASQMGTDTSAQSQMGTSSQSQMGTTTPDQSTTGSVNPPVSADATSAGVDTAANANTNVRVITNGPVADTPENRAKFPPLSKTGRNTTPRGN